VLISDFPHDVKRRWIGDNYRLEARTSGMKRVLVSGIKGGVFRESKGYVWRE
jgi:hypothetical protein